MKVTAEFNRAELEGSMLRWSKKYGETTKQAVLRWSVQTCREMALETQVWGRKVKETKGKQVAAIWQDMWNVIYLATRIPRNSSSSKYLKSPEEVYNWMEQNTRKGKRTRWLPIEQRKIATLPTIRKALKIKLARAGMAKGGWIGAGNEIAKAQRGPKREKIGKNFLAYAQKHERFGTARRPTRGRKPVARMTNKASHAGLNYVLRKGASRKAIDEGLKKTVKYYQMSVRAMNRRR